jgi:hypothetical protein
MHSSKRYREKNDVLLTFLWHLDSSHCQWNKGGVLYLTEIETRLLNTVEAPCESNSIQDFLECSKNEIRNYASRNLTCVIFQFSEVLNSSNPDLPDCVTESDASKNLQLF